MRPLSLDIPPEIERRLIEIYRRMTPQQRLERVLDPNRTGEALARLRIGKRFGPDLDRSEIELRLAALRIPRELRVAAFGWDPHAEGC